MVLSLPMHWLKLPLESNNLHLQGIHPGEGGIFNFPSGGDGQTGPVRSCRKNTDSCNFIVNKFYLYIFRCD